ncbi:MFS transporter, partial [Aeromonas hydrophila]
MSSPCAPTAAHGSKVDVRPRLLGFLALALMSALLNSSVPTPLYPHYQAALALSDLGLSLIYGGYAGGVLIALFGVGNLAGRVADLCI